MKLRGQPAPKLIWRIAWWFGTYLVLSELLVLLEPLIGPYGSRSALEWHELLRGLLLVPFIFPMYLACWTELWTAGASSRLDPFVPYVCYGLYLLHLFFTVRAKRLVSFLVMLSILLLVMIVSVLGLWATVGD